MTLDDKYKILALDHKVIKQVQIATMQQLIDKVLKGKIELDIFSGKESCKVFIGKYLDLEHEQDRFICLNKKLIVDNIADTNYLDDIRVGKDLEIKDVINKTKYTWLKSFLQWLLELSNDSTFINIYSDICKKFAYMYIDRVIDKLEKRNRTFI